MTDTNLHIPELKSAFSGWKFFRKSDLVNFYRSQPARYSVKDFRRILYGLEKRGLIRSVDAGVYILSNEQPASRPQKKFLPVFSPELSVLNESLQTAFPYTEYLLWETRILHEFMLHQPGKNQAILETEKEAVESVFNFLSSREEGKVFMQPDRITLERYVYPKKECIIVTKLITQSPQQEVNEIPCPKLEKILVDVFADAELFYIFQGQELVNIFETAFHTYRISEKTLFRYAGRRKVSQKIRAFITQQTNIQLIQQNLEAL
jgi:ATP-dependent helicase YprA (DUF1998 family)